MSVCLSSPLSHYLPSTHPSHSLPSFSASLYVCAKTPTIPPSAFYSAAHTLRDVLKCLCRKCCLLPDFLWPLEFIHRRWPLFENMLCNRMGCTKLPQSSSWTVLCIATSGLNGRWPALIASHAILVLLLTTGYFVDRGEYILVSINPALFNSVHVI